MSHNQQPYRGSHSKIAPPASNRKYTNLDTSSGRLTNHYSRTLHIVYPQNFQRHFSGDPVMQKHYSGKGASYKLPINQNCTFSYSRFEPTATIKMSLNLFILQSQDQNNLKQRFNLRGIILSALIILMQLPAHKLTECVNYILLGSIFRTSSGLVPPY